MLKRSRKDEASSSETDSVNSDHHNAQKYVQIDSENELRDEVTIMCSHPPHTETFSFSSYDAYEVHYNQAHVNRCFECHKNLPTEHFLSLHIGENHDPLNQAKRAQGEKTYACFVEGCDKVCLNPHKRRMHLVDKHAFPKNYDFSVVNDGIDKRQSMLRPNHAGAPRALSTGLVQKMKSRQGTTSAVIETSEESRSRKHVSQNEDAVPEVRLSTARNKGSSVPERTDHELEIMTKAMSALQFLPQSVRFGRGGGRSGFVNR